MACLALFCTISIHHVILTRSSSSSADLWRILCKKSETCWFFLRRTHNINYRTLKFANFHVILVIFRPYSTIAYDIDILSRKSRILACFRPIWHNIGGFWMIIHTMSVSKSSKSLQEPDDFSLQRSRNTKI